MELAIREIREEDLNALLGLYLHLHESALPPQGEKLFAVWRKIMRNDGYHIFVGELDGRLVSSVTMCVLPNLTRGLRPYALIENVVTHADFRRRGYAAALLGEAARCAREAGCYKVMLLTGSKDEATFRFYERAGFNSGDKTGFVKWL